MKSTAIAVALLGALVLAGCSTTQVTSVAMGDEKRVCIIDNPRVRGDFAGAYRRALEGRGFQVEVLPESAEISACPVTSRFTGNYYWDLIVYLKYAEIQVYRDGKAAGRAVYNAEASRSTPESTIRSMVDELFKN